MKLSKEQIVEIIRISSEINRAQFPEWRTGQTFFNVLYTKYPDIANEIRGTQYDPFHNDERVMTCCEYILRDDEEKDPEVIL
jgi:hypothetical protein